MNQNLILIAVFLVIGGLIILYRFWDSPLEGNEKESFPTKKQLRLHSLIIGYGSIVIGFIILLYIIFS